MLCENPHCSSPASNQTRLCNKCLDNLYLDLRTVSGLYEALEIALTAKGAQSDRVTGTKESKGISLAQPALEGRVYIEHHVRRWSKYTADSRGIAKPADSVDAAVAFLLKHANWIASQPGNAGSFYTAVREMANGAPWRAAYPERTRKFIIGQCPKVTPEGRCAGQITVILRKLENDLPSVLVCGDNPEHTWDDSEWLNLGNHMARMGMVA